VDTREQLQNITQLRVVSYRYDDQFAEMAGLAADQRTDTGVLAQELHSILPDAVLETGDVILPSGETIPNLLVVNKVVIRTLFCGHSLAMVCTGPMVFAVDDRRARAFKLL